MDTLDNIDPVFKYLIDNYNELDTVIFLNTIVDNVLTKNRTNFNIEFRDLEQKLKISRYKIKKIITVLIDENIVDYKQMGSKHNGVNNLKININHTIIKKLLRLKGDGMKKSYLLNNLKLKGKPRKEVDEEGTLGMWYKINGRKDIINFGVQKYLKAVRHGNWNDVTYRDLASWLVYVDNNNYGGNLKIHGRNAGIASQLIKKIVEKYDIDKKDWVLTVKKLLEVYEQEYKTEKFKGITWGFLRNESFQEEIFKKVKSKQAYQKESYDLNDYVPEDKSANKPKSKIKHTGNNPKSYF